MTLRTGRRVVAAAAASVLVAGAAVVVTRLESAPVGGAVILAADPFHACPRPDAHRGTQAEPSLAVHPADPNQLVAVWQQNRREAGLAQGLVGARSGDGGSTWSALRLPDMTCPADKATVTDPWVSISTDGTTYVAWLRHRNFEGREVEEIVAGRASAEQSGLSTSVLTRRDVGGGRPALDKVSTLADPHSPARVYVAWTEDVGERQTLRFTSTSNAGASWSSPVSVAVGGVPVANPQVLSLGPGRLVLLYAQPLFRPLVRDHIVIQITARRSLDHGRTWGEPTPVAELLATRAEGRPPNQLRGYSQNFAASVGADGIPVVAWFDEETAHGRAYIAQGSRDGVGWGGPVVVRTAARDALVQGVARQADGRVAVFSYETAGGGLRAVLYVLADGIWQERRLSQAFRATRAPLTRGGRFLGDYQGVVAGPTGFVAVFAAPAPSTRGTAIHVERVP